MKKLLSTTIATSVGALTVLAGGYAFTDGPYVWQTGDATRFVAGYANDPDSMRIYAERDLNVLARHVRIEAQDGNIELESSGPAPTRLNPYTIGSATRKPLQIGQDDGQDLLSLIVDGHAGQRNPLQEWRAAGVPVAAIDAGGSLHLRGAVIMFQASKRTYRLVVRFPNGIVKPLAEAAR